MILCKKTIYTYVYNYFYSFFTNGFGEEVIYLAKEHNKFLPRIENKTLYLDFYMKDSCPKGIACYYSSSYSYIPFHRFWCLIQYSKELLEKYNIIEKDEIIKLEKSKAKLIPLKSEKEESKEKESKESD